MGIVGARWDMQRQVFRALLDRLDMSPTEFSHESLKHYAEIGGGIDLGNCTRVYGNARDPRNFGPGQTPRVAKLMALEFKERLGIDWVGAGWFLSLFNSSLSPDGWDLFISDEDNVAILEEVTDRSLDSFTAANERLSA
jgi:hypothetical protein